MNTIQTDTEVLQKITEFINGIGIPCQPSTIERTTFLPGIDVEDGCIYYDIDKLMFPGDLLHEAGHIAVLPIALRKQANNNNVNGDLGDGAELAAIAWSWAALTYLQLQPEIVFHPQGYHNGSESIIENFSSGKYFGVSLLQWLGLTYEPAKAIDGKYEFPAMKQWLRV